MSRQIPILLLLASALSCCTASRHSSAVAPPVSSTVASNPVPSTTPAPPSNALIPDYTKAMITAPPAALSLDTFYKKYTDAWGIPIVSSARTPDAALLIARDIVNYMLMKRTDVREALIHQKARVLVMAQTEMETDLPERRDWKKPARDEIGRAHV